MSYDIRVVAYNASKESVTTGYMLMIITPPLEIFNYKLRTLQSEILFVLKKST